MSRMLQTETGEQTVTAVPFIMVQCDHLPFRSFVIQPELSHLFGDVVK